MALPTPLNPPVPTSDLSETQRNIVLQDEAIARTLLQDLQSEWDELNTFRNYYDGDQALVYGSEKFKEKFPDFAGFEDNWTAVVVDALADKIKMIGLDLTSDDGTPGDEDTPEETEESRSISQRIWEVFEANDIDEQESLLTEGVFVEGRGAVIVWPDPELGARIDWNPAQLVKVKYSEDDYRVKEFAVKRWETSSGRIRINVYDRNSVRKYLEAGTTPRGNTNSGSVTDQIPSGAPGSGLVPYLIPGESWPLPHDFGEVPVVEFTNKRGSELSDVIPLQDAINYMLVASFVAADFAALRQRVMLTGANTPSEGWKNEPGVIWKLPPIFDTDGKPHFGSIAEFGVSELGQFETIIQLVLHHLAMTSKTPVRMFMKTDRGGRGDAQSGESQLIEDEPLLDKAEDRQTRLGNRWIQVCRLVAKALDISGRITGHVVWQDPRSKYRSLLLDDAIKMANPDSGLGLPIEWVVKHLGLSPDDLRELLAAIQEQKQQLEEQRQEELERESQRVAVGPGSGSDSSDSSNSDE